MENFGGGDFCRGGVEQGINSVVLGKVKFDEIIFHSVQSFLVADECHT